jgi:hypothetical protein
MAVISARPRQLSGSSAEVSLHSVGSEGRVEVALSGEVQKRVKYAILDGLHVLLRQ